MPKDCHIRRNPGQSTAPERKRDERRVDARILATRLDRPRGDPLGRSALHRADELLVRCRPARDLFSFQHRGAAARQRRAARSGVLEASEFGKFLPSNVALEFSIQYESAIAFGSIRVVVDADEQRHALYGLLKKYFSTMTPGLEFRPITDQELKRTSVYAIHIDSWSGKHNWAEEAEQSDEWPR